MSRSGYVAIIDYQISNLFSVQHALQYVGLNSVITSDKNKVIHADAAVLPGVGAFGDAMNNLDNLDLIQPIKDFISSGKPFMGICLGLQLLFTESEEFGKHQGLCVVPGIVRKFAFDTVPGERIAKVPQIAWNRIHRASQKWEGTELDSLTDGEYMYFVHSFYVVPDSKRDIMSTTEYGGLNFCSSIKRNNVFAAQFHPEKSSRAGIKILNNLKNIVDRDSKYKQ
ncbi:MAG: imidazole glycerol phosphate synthase subunit HisH [Oscillospiraceae bacterium]